MPIDESADIGFELSDGGMNTSLEPLSGEFSEPTLDLIDPLRRSRRESSAGPRLLAIECLGLALLIDAEDERSVRRGKVKADDIAYLVDEQRIVRQLECWLRCGCKPNATHIRRTVVWEKPVSAAIERIDQCVASNGVVRNVRSITAATWSSSIVRGRPGRASQVDHRSDPSKIGDATCQRCVRGDRVQPQHPCSASRPRIAE